MLKVYSHKNGLFFERAKGEHFLNTHFENQRWFIWNYHHIKLGLNKKLFGRGDCWHYDGHTYDSFVIFGLEIGKGYTYQSKALAEWTSEELNDPWFEKPED